MIWGRLGPVFVLILVFVMDSSICLAAPPPQQQQKAPCGIKAQGEACRARAGRGGRKPQQTRHGAWRSHGSPARKGVLRPAPRARWGATPNPHPVPFPLLRPLRYSHYPLPQPTVFPCSTSTTLSHLLFPHPTNVSVFCPIPTVLTALSPSTASFLLPQHVAPPTASPPQDNPTPPSGTTGHHSSHSLPSRTTPTPRTRPKRLLLSHPQRPDSRGHSHCFHRWA